MGESIFSVDYSCCADANREVQSNINYIDEILDIIDNMNEDVEEIDGGWDRSLYDQNAQEMKDYLSKEKERYDSFYTNFNSFYCKIEGIDASLKSLFESEVNYVEDEGSYEFYLAIIQTDISENLDDSMYDKLIELGLSEDEAMKVTVFCSSEMADEINKLSNMSEEEIQKYINSINAKENKSPLEIILLDILSLNSGQSYLDMLATISEDVAEGKWDTVILGKQLDKEVIEEIEKSYGFISNKITALEKQIDSGQLSEFKTNKVLKEIEKLKSKRDNLINNSANSKVASYGGRINKIKQRIESGKYSAEEIEKLNAKLLKYQELKENSITNYSKAQKIKNCTFKGSKQILNVAQLVVAVWQGIEIGVEEQNQIMKYGKEVDDAVVDGALDVGSIAAGMWAGGTAGAAIGAAATAVVGSLPGAAIGFIGGCVVGGVTSFAFDSAVHPVLKNAYDDYVEPAAEWVKDKVNDIGDWWDTLLW